MLIGYLYVFEEISIQGHCPFFFQLAARKGLFGFLLLSYNNSLLILNFSLLLYTWLANILSISVTFLFAFLVLSFDVQTVLNFDELQFIYFSFVVCLCDVSIHEHEMYFHFFRSSFFLELKILMFEIKKVLWMRLPVDNTSW